MAITVRVGDEWAAFEPQGTQGKLIADAPPVKPAKPKRPSQTKVAEEKYAFQCEAYRLPRVERGLMFARGIGRRWQFDFAFAEYMLAVEIEGLMVQRFNGRLLCTGRHTTPGGFEGDCEKYATAVLLGWTVVRFMTKQVPSKYAIDMTQRILMSRGWKGANHASESTAASPAAAPGSLLPKIDRG
jgi:hypothetical protein